MQGLRVFSSKRRRKASLPETLEPAANRLWREAIDMKTITPVDQTPVMVTTRVPLGKRWFYRVFKGKAIIFRRLVKQSDTRAVHQVEEELIRFIASLFWGTESA